MTPWLAFALIVLGLTASIVGSLLKVGGPTMGLAFGVATLGLAYLQARGHRDTQRAYVQLRESMRPPATTLPDAEAIRKASAVNKQLRPPWSPPRG